MLVNGTVEYLRHHDRALRERLSAVDYFAVGKCRLLAESGLFPRRCPGDGGRCSREVSAPPLAAGGRAFGPGVRSLCELEYGASRLEV